jgi:hypothetical protein
MEKLMIYKVEFQEQVMHLVVLKIPPLVKFDDAFFFNKYMLFNLLSTRRKRRRKGMMPF